MSIWYWFETQKKNKAHILLYFQPTPLNSSEAKAYWNVGMPDHVQTQQKIIPTSAWAHMT